MGTDLLPEWVRENWEVHEWKHACAILKGDFPDEWKDLCGVLGQFRLKKGYITKGGGNKSEVSGALDSNFYRRGWKEHHFDTKVTVDGVETPSPTHAVDCYRNGVGVEVEWNNKDPFFDRDLNNFRLLFELRVISVGVIITRCDELQDIFNSLGRKTSYGMSTTHMSKLLPKVRGGGAGGCPLLVLGIGKKLYVEDEEVEPETEAAALALAEEDEE